MGCKLELDLLETFIKYTRQKLNVATKTCFLACFQPMQNSWCLFDFFHATQMATIYSVGAVTVVLLSVACTCVARSNVIKVSHLEGVHFCFQIFCLESSYDISSAHPCSPQSHSHPCHPSTWSHHPCSCAYFFYFFHDWHLLIRLREVQQCLTIIRHTFSCTAKWCLVPKTVYMHADVLCATLCLFFYRLFCFDACLFSSTWPRWRQLIQLVQLHCVQLYCCRLPVHV